MNFKTLRTAETGKKLPKNLQVLSLKNLELAIRMKFLK